MNEKDLTADLDGATAGKAPVGTGGAAPPGGAVGGAVPAAGPKLRTEPQSGGKRLSKRSRTTLAFIGLGLVALILVGIMTAGEKPVEKAQEKLEGGGGDVGMIPPAIRMFEANAQKQELAERAAGLAWAKRPLPAGTPSSGNNPVGETSVPSTEQSAPVHLTAGQAPAGGTPTGQSLRGSSSGPGFTPLSTESLALPSAGAGPGAAPQAQTPQSQYAAWVEQQKYRRLENEEMAAQSAASAHLLEGGGVGEATGNASGASSDLLSPGAGDVAGSLASTLGNDKSLVDLQRALLESGHNRDTGNASEAFLRQRENAGGYLSDTEIPALGQHELVAGSVIPATLVTAINSDLPGTITAIVRQTVYDSLHPDVVLIPQGTRLVGEYSSNVGYGQRRVLAAWDEMIFPDGATIDLKRMEGVNGQGQGGFHDLVDNHYLRVFGSSILMSVLGVAAQLSQPQNSSVLQTQGAGQSAAAATAASINQTASELLQRNLNIAPTLVIRPGFNCNVMVNKTMILPPYGGHSP